MSEHRNELANCITHAVATALSLACLVLLVVFASRRGSVWHVVSFSIYGTTMFVLFLSSTLYHGFSNPRLKHLFHVIDHVAIYLLIAGTYTPFVLTVFRESHPVWSWTLFGVVWGIAAVGVALKIFYTGRFKMVSTGLYLLMGWLIVMAAKPLYDTIPRSAFFWLAAGGLMYTLGVVFYLMDRMPWHHAVWHLFVLAAALSHFVGIFFYILP